MTQAYTSGKDRNKFLHLLGIFTTIVFLWLFIPSGYAAQGTHPVFVTVQSGDTLFSLFRKQHISPKTLAVILKNPTASNTLKHLHINQHLRFSLDSKNNLESLAVALSRTKTLLVYRAGTRFIARIENGSFSVPKVVKKAVPRPVAKPKPPQPVAKKPVARKAEIKKPLVKIIKKPAPAPEKNKIKIAPKITKLKPTPKPISIIPALRYDGIIIQHSFYSDAQKEDIPDDVINQIMQIFALQVNFKSTHPGDILLVAYDDDDTVIAAQFIQGPRTFSAIRYVNAQGVVEYFSPDGESMKKAFNRFPVKYTHINSLFNMHRMHPVTHVIRPHTGVDLAGALGTPVYSIGDGQVSFIGWEGAYGNIVSIQHNDKYSSKYAHLLRFAPNLSKGSRVKRGQLIGYLGQTGNATGPHVHFEVRVYNVPVDPLTVRTPQASAVPPSQIKAFQARAKSLLAGLSYYQKTQMKS